MKNTNAIKPDLYFRDLPTLQLADKEAEKNGATEEEKAIYSMTLSHGWIIMRKHIEQLVKELDQVNKTAIENGASLEDIGRNTIVVSLTQDIIKKILDKADDAEFACTQNEQ